MAGGTLPGVDLAARAVLDTGPTPTAMLTFNDRAAMGLLDALIRAGVDVPGAVSVTPPFYSIRAII